MSTSQPTLEAAVSRPGAPATLSDAELARALERGPRGAWLLSALAVGLLFVGWILFYFLLFMRRGPIG